MSNNIIKKDEIYYPKGQLKREAELNEENVYQEAGQDPLAFWEKRAQGLYWRRKWDQVFEHQPPYFKWFVNGKLNITENIFEKNQRGWDRIQDKTAIIWQPECPDEDVRKISYKDLQDIVNQVANGLKQLGVKKGDRVAIYLPMLPEAIVAMLACARIGAVHSVVFSAYSPTALRTRILDSQAKVLITADGYYRRGKIVDLKKNADKGAEGTSVETMVVVERVGNNRRQGLPVPASPCLAGRRAADGRQAGGVENPCPAYANASAGKQGGVEKMEEITWHQLLQGQSKQCPAETMDSEDLQFILYTSGSTGTPKGTMQACGGYMVQSYWTGKWIFDWKENDVFWSTADIGWITGHTYSCYAPLLNGITFLIYEGAPDWPEPNRWAKIIEQHKITIFYTAPTAVRMFRKYGEDKLKGIDLSSLRILGSVGEPIDESSWQWYFKYVGNENCPVLDTWWQTETGGILITSLPGIGPFRPCYTGRPLPGLVFDILNDNGKQVAIGKKGKLVLRPPFSPGLLRGVYKNPEKYKSTYWSKFGDKVYFTEDAALRDEQGLFRIVGRTDDVLKVAGHRLTTGEMEDAITRLDEVAECAVVGVPHEIKGEVPVVFAVKARGQGGQVLKEKIVKTAREEISPIAKPEQVYLVDDLPKTRSGKIMRRILRSLLTGVDLGDVSTLANAECLEGLKKALKQ